MTDHLLVIGGQRCGTTYLYRLLDEHPQVDMAKPVRPEPKFFLDPDSLRLGLDWYEKTYFGSDRDGVLLLGEKSTSYIESADAARRAAALLGTPHVVALLRDPVERAVSNWRFSAANGREDRPLEQALTESLGGSRPWDRTATSVSPYAYVERGRYIDLLQPWSTLFGDRLHVRFLEEMVGIPSSVAEMYATLGLDDDFAASSLHSHVNTNPGVSPPVDSLLRQQLRSAFADSDERLRAWLGRPLPWDSAS